MTTLMFVSALLLLLVAAPADADQGPGCSYRGRFIDNGAFFRASNRCTELLCDNGRIRTIKKRCAFEGACYAVDQEFRGGRNGCILYRCQRNEQFKAVDDDPYKCKDYFNRCKICED